MIEFLIDVTPVVVSMLMYIAVASAVEILAFGGMLIVFSSFSSAFEAWM